jgi:hypothetical protein
MLVTAICSNPDDTKEHNSAQPSHNTSLSAVCLRSRPSFEVAMACMSISEEHSKEFMPSSAKTGGKQEIAQSRSSSYRAARLRDFHDPAKA